MNTKGLKVALASAAKASRTGWIARILAACWRASVLSSIVIGIIHWSQMAAKYPVRAIEWLRRSLHGSFVSGAFRVVRDIPHSTEAAPGADHVLRIRSWLVAGAPLAAVWLPWKTGAIVMLLSFGAAAWVGAGPGPGYVHRTVIWWLAAGVGVTAMSMAFSRAPAASFLVWLQWLTWFILAWMAFRLSHLLARPPFPIALAITASALGALAVAQARAGWGDIAGWVPAGLRPEITFRVPGPLGNPNIFAAAMNLILWPLVLGQGGIIGLRARPARAIAVALAGVALGLTFSRAAWLGSAMVLFTIVTRRAARRRIGPAAFLILAAAGIFLAAPGLLSIPALKSAALIRASIWSRALEAWRGQPLFGTGPGGFRNIMLAGGGMADHAHNAFLQVLAETGAAGLVVVVAGAAALWRRTSRLLASRGSAGSPAAAGIAAGLWAVMFQGLFDVPWASPALAALWWVWLGFFLGLSQKDPDSHTFHSVVE